MSKPAFFIDGYTEKLIVEKICPGSPIRRIDLNGKNVAISAIAKKIAPLIRLLGNRNYPIVILIDKEQRNDTINEIIKTLEKELKELGITDDLRIGGGRQNDRELDSCRLGFFSEINKKSRDKAKIN